MTCEKKVEGSCLERRKEISENQKETRRPIQRGNPSQGSRSKSRSPTQSSESANWGEQEEDQVRGHNRRVGRTKSQQEINPHNKLKVQSIQSKLYELSFTLNEIDPDIVILTETWCNSNISSDILQIPGYTIEESLRKDRQDTVNGIGGGIMFMLG